MLLYPFLFFFLLAIIELLYVSSLKTIVGVKGGYFRCRKENIYALKS